jgi:MinD-like ATPase involved in chromosome partitioning or flagellar assembly
MIPADIRLYTWVDVEEVLHRALQEKEWPEGIEWARCYWDGLTIGILQEEKDKIKKWLAEKFDPRFNYDASSIILESLPNIQRTFSIFFEDAREEPLHNRFIPSFARPSVLIRSGNPEHPSSLSSELPPVIAFHSFKGGVGRTIHAISLALKLIEHKQEVLLIDGDLEAPGISWLLRKRLPNPSVSFVDYLALIHSDPDPSASSSIELVASKLKDFSIDGIFILPAFRSMSHFNSIEIKPENIIKGAKDLYILTEMLAKLGKTLNVDAVIVDLRAGLSELSAGLILDPRVYRISVSTLSGQSLQGTKLLLDLVNRASPSTKDEEPLPALIISQVTEEFQNEDRINNILEILSNAVMPLADDAEAGNTKEDFD